MYKKIQHNPAKTEIYNSAFSLAEMMVVMLILTIVLAATVPIISKRAKMKNSSNSESGTLKTCTKTVTSYLETNLTADIKNLRYTMYGGGGGGGGIGNSIESCSWSGTSYPFFGDGGGGGGSSAILLDNTVMAFASGGSGGKGVDRGYNVKANNGADGSYAEGVVPLTLPSYQILRVYVGGGGGGGGSTEANFVSNAGGGSGYFGGGEGYHGVCVTNYPTSAGTGGGGGTGTSGGTSSGSNATGGLLYGGTKNATGGAGMNAGTLQTPNSACPYDPYGQTAYGRGYGYGGGGGGYGGKGGDGGSPSIGSGGSSGSTRICATNGTTTGTGTGKGGAGATNSSVATGGDGGSVTLIYMTTGSCSL